MIWLLEHDCTVCSITSLLQTYHGSEVNYSVQCSSEDWRSAFVSERRHDDAVSDESSRLSRYFQRHPLLCAARLRLFLLAAAEIYMHTVSRYCHCFSGTVPFRAAVSHDALTPYTFIIRVATFVCARHSFSRGTLLFLPLYTSFGLGKPARRLVTCSTAVDALCNVHVQFQSTVCSDVTQPTS